MQLYLVRHAESKNNASPAHLRVEDPTLTAVGRLQGEKLADWMRTLRMDALITSPVRRALQTTRYVRDATSQHVHVWDSVFEEGGIYRGHGPNANEGGPGLTRDDVIEHVTGDESGCTLDESITPAGWWGSRPRESPEDAQSRAALLVERLTSRFGPDEVVVMISHADFKRRLLHELIGHDANPQSFGKLRNTGITKIDWDGKKWQLDWFNSVSHLPARLITGNE
jgi:2,3-bisphosphoglycerate-dependent phosphoglycerate mutase